jgi:hypothetical protein
MLLVVMKDRPTRIVPLGFYVDALDEVVDDARLLGWRRSVEAAGETIEELSEAEAACVAGIESPGPFGELRDISFDLVELERLRRRHGWALSHLVSGSSLNSAPSLTPGLPLRSCRA